MYKFLDETDIIPIYYFYSYFFFIVNLFIFFDDFDSNLSL